MQRRLVLSKGAYLWEEGDYARNIAVLERGRLAVRAGKNIIGIIHPQMVLGEGAILTVDGQPQPRTASVYALQDDTAITEYPAVTVRQAIESAHDAVGQRILTTLVGQACRNCLVIMSSHKGHSIVEPPLKALTQGLVQTTTEIPAIRTWSEFMVAFRFLYTLRDITQTLREQLLGASPTDIQVLLQSSETVKQLFSGQDIAGMLDSMINAEKEKAQWLEVDPGR